MQCGGCVLPQSRCGGERPRPPADHVARATGTPTCGRRGASLTSQDYDGAKPTADRSFLAPTRSFSSHDLRIIRAVPHGTDPNSVPKVHLPTIFACPSLSPCLLRRDGRSFLRGRRAVGAPGSGPDEEGDDEEQTRGMDGQRRQSRYPCMGTGRVRGLQDHASPRGASQPLHDQVTRRSGLARRRPDGRLVACDAA